MLVVGNYVQQYKNYDKTFVYLKVGGHAVRTLKVKQTFAKQELF
jgi:hypothetical protein